MGSPELAEHLETTELVLAELGLVNRPRLRVYSKVDRLPPEERAALEERADGVLLSVHEPSALAELRVALAAACEPSDAETTLPHELLEHAEPSY